jgi:hypothetical protein
MPINGRNYMELAQQITGVRVNAITSDTPLGGNNSGKFQISLSGLQVTQDTADAASASRVSSPDAISQFQIITNRFDATRRSSGVRPACGRRGKGDQIHGSVFGLLSQRRIQRGFDPVAHIVTKLSDQQYGGPSSVPSSSRSSGASAPTGRASSQWRLAARSCRQRTSCGAADP